MLAVLVVLSGCVNQHPKFASPAITLPPEETLPPFDPVYTPLMGPWAEDSLGAKIQEADHFFWYLSFQEMRVYEYSWGTLLDGICVNEYPEPLWGELEIVFWNKEKQEVARASLHTADPGFVLQPGENRIYAEINTDMDIQMAPFTLEVKERIQPQL